MDVAADPPEAAAARPVDKGPRVWLIGESNPYSDDPRYALYPLPERASGGRLCRILGLTSRDYLRTFERRDLLSTARWSVPQARVAAAALLHEVGAGDALVLCGGKVAAAFGFEYAALAAHTTATGHAALVIPHPSGLNRQWSATPGLAARVREAVMALVRAQKESAACPTS